MRTPIRLVAGLAAALLMLGAVGEAAAQKRGGTLTIVRPTDPVSLEPNLETTAPGAWVYFNMLEGLLTLDEKMQVKPALATSYELLVLARFAAGLPHGAYFGVASLVAASMARPSRKGRAVSQVMLGLSVANVLGVPAATVLGQELGWRAALHRSPPPSSGSGTAPPVVQWQ